MVRLTHFAADEIEDFFDMMDNESTEDIIDHLVEQLKQDYLDGVHYLDPQGEADLDYQEYEDWRPNLEELADDGVAMVEFALKRAPEAQEAEVWEQYINYFD